MTTKRQYLNAINTINKANAAAALAVVANYKDEQASNR